MAEPFVAVNCAALPGALLESELFGHVRGAFTGAVASRRGAFALAGRGTIFLDEIGDTTLEFQSKLLRVLQDREFRPVGAEQAERAEARVVAATHRNLEALVAERAFREDLYYRLHVLEIVLPPLRERPRDIPLLVGHLVAGAAAALETAESVVSPEALDRLTRYSWPGNVRELENCLTGAVVQASGGVIRPEHLALAAPAATAAPSPLRPLDEVEREHVARVLEAVGGHKGRAAEALGVSRPRLNRLLAKYRLG
jgi:transcriptional regulator with PAS, ATPase and Fis domain